MNQIGPRTKLGPLTDLSIVSYWNTVTHIHLHIISVAAEVNSCDREQMHHKASNIYYLTLYRKSLLTPVVSKFSIMSMCYFCHLLLKDLLPHCEECNTLPMLDFI